MKIYFIKTTTIYVLILGYNLKCIYLNTTFMPPEIVTKKNDTLKICFEKYLLFLFILSYIDINWAF